jgi:hypothetical protein
MSRVNLGLDVPDGTNVERRFVERSGDVLARLRRLRGQTAKDLGSS